MKGKVNYKRYSVLVKHVGFLEVIACNYEAMLADIEEAYYQPEVITWTEYER